MTGFDTPACADVVVAGGGFAGLAAAIETRLQGASVLLLEAAPPVARGGNARHSRNIRLANAAQTPFQRGSYPVEEYLADLSGLAPPRPALARQVVQDSADLGHWMAGQGIRFEPWSAGNLPYSRKTMFLRGGGQAMVNALYARAEALGVQVAYDTRLTDLPAAAMVQDTPLELAARSPRGPWPVRAGAVVLACGAALPQGVANRGTPFQRGELLAWLVEHGAAEIGSPGQAHLVAVDARAPQDDAGIVSRMDGMAMGIVVGCDGARFQDEGATLTPARFSRWGQILAARGDGAAWLVLDADGAARLPPLLYPPLRAETLRALAGLCGIDPQGLARTVTEYNRAVQEGAPPDPPHTAPAPPLLRPPFAAFPMRPGAAFSRHGVAVDSDGRVETAFGESCPRLFAAGALMAPAVLGEGYVSGAALAIAGVFGRRAGRAAADAGATGVAPRLPRPAFPASPPPAGDPLEEAARVLNICNTCGFCSGLCDVFPAAQLREGLARGDIRHLAHLCHDCRSCFYDCQYVPPHDFAVNVPQTLSAVRMVEYGGGASMPWRVFLACTLGLPLLVLGLIPAEVLFSAHQGPGAFYRVIPHGVMSGLAGLALGGAAAGLTWRVWRFWRAGRGPQVRLGPRAILWALWDVASLRNLGDCETRHGTTGRARRWAHHALAYGFGLTFLATLWAGGLHAAGQSAPYPMFSPPVLLGALGGAGMLAGVVGLGWLRGRADRAPAAPAQEAADRGARRALGTVAASGLALLTFRDTAAMGLLLALHLGSVLGLGLGVPFGKLSHGGYRAVALLRNRAERAHRQP